MPHNAALVFDAINPCPKCDQPNFLTVFHLDRRFPGYVDRSGVRVNWGLVQADRCTNCGHLTHEVVRRAGATRIKRPIRPEVVASLRMQVRIH